MIKSQDTVTRARPLAVSPKTVERPKARTEDVLPKSAIVNRKLI